jgi:hypothetical protein
MFLYKYKQVKAIEGDSEVDYATDAGGGHVVTMIMSTSAINNFV